MAGSGAVVEAVWKVQIDPGVTPTLWTLRDGADALAVLICLKRNRTAVAHVLLVRGVVS